jgi:tryptophan synthase alpha chain
MARSIQQTFQELKRDGKTALVAFVTAGYPDIQTTPAVLQAIDRAGASVIEIGFPFSDPIADGPVIQESFTAALAKKIKVADVLAMVKAARPNIQAPLVAMLSYSIVFRYGALRFLADAKGAGFNGIIIPDLPPPEAEKICGQTREMGLDSILLIAPTTSHQRKREIVDLCSGFVYYLSVSGITGERDALPADLAPNLAEIKAMTDLPICVGFGIHKREQIAQIARIADGAIIGTAIIRKMKEKADQGAEAIAGAVGEYVGSLRL